MELDVIDKKLIQLLQENSKRTNKELAHKIDLSVTAVYERIKRLERTGVIEKYVAIVDAGLINKPFMVFCQIKLIQHTKSFLTKFEAEVVQLDEVSECYHTTGDYDYLLKIFVKDMEAYREFMVNKLTTLRHIGSTQSAFTISEVKNQTAVSLDETI